MEDSRTAEERRLELLVGAGHDLTIVHDGDETDEGEPRSGSEAEEPEAYGVRVGWQPEAVRIEAAEFMIATRVQQAARLRATHAERLRHHEEPDQVVVGSTTQTDVPPAP